MQMLTNKLMLASAATLITCSSHAAVIGVTNSSANILNDADNSVGDGVNSDTIASFSLNGGNAVVLFFGGENGNGLTATYGGEAMTVVENTSGSSQHTGAIAYLINPTATTANIELSWGDFGNDEVMIGAIALSNVGGVAGSASRDSSSTLSFNYTTTLDGGYVVGTGTNNNFNGPSPAVSGNWDTFQFNGTVSGNSSVVFVHGDVATAGSYTDTLGGNPNVASAAGVAFEAVPEPGSLALLGLGGLLIASRRRRA